MDRLQTLIHHITTLCSPEQLGRTKLAKIVWLSDVESYRLTGRTITQSDNYVKDEFGPRHRDLYSAIDSLKKSGIVVESANPTPVGVRHELFPIATPDLSDFSAEEIAIVDRIAARISRLSAKDASDLTHDALWQSATFNERLPVAAAAPVEGELTPELLVWAELVLDEYSEASKRVSGN